MRSRVPRCWTSLTVLLLWLPLEFSAGANLIPRPAQGFLHSVAYGIAILLALVLFWVFRSVPGLKFNLPRDARDYWLPLVGLPLPRRSWPSQVSPSDSFRPRTFPPNLRAA